MMVFTLTWKEIREHQAIWITMVGMSVGLGLGLAKVISLQNANLALPVAAFTILGMAATYGVVCGSMMFAGEHEGGTLVFLDIFLGRRGLLWSGKFLIGGVLAVTQAVTVAFILGFLQQEPPNWILTLVGNSVEIIPRRGMVGADPRIWFVVLPVVTLEAYCWGLLGSSLTQRVLAGAAVAAIGFTPVWLFALVAPPSVFFGFRLVLAIGLLAMSAAIFMSQSREKMLSALSPPEPEGPREHKDEFLDLWDRFERLDRRLEQTAATEAPVAVAAPERTVEPQEDEPPRPVSRRFDDEPDQAKSPREVLWWLTLQQAWPVLWGLAIAGFALGLIIVPANFQVLWPLVTLLLGVACGTAAFAPEQRDLSYEFLAAQHFPVRYIWRFKLLFWLTVGVGVAMLMVVGSVVHRLIRPAVDVGFRGTFYDLTGAMLFFGVWLAYGFAAGQVFVWLCRKSILALLISTVVAGGAVGVWLPSLLCGGMGGWQLWVPPLTALLATWTLTRAWTGGRIWERKPMAALVAFGIGATVWTLLCFGLRAWEVPDAGEPLNITAFKDSIPVGKENDAARVIQQAVGMIADPNDAWLKPMAEAAQMPVGVLESPRAEGEPVLQHLPACRKISDALVNRAAQADQEPGFEYLAQLLALSRNLRKMAPLESYLAGAKMEEDALTALDKLLARRKPTPRLLRRVLNELNRHATETPPALDCLQTECFRSSGTVENASVFTFARGVPERWVSASIVLSLEAPWESERKTRIWQLVWAGLFRGIETPHWELPEASEEFHPRKSVTREIMAGWLPAEQGPGAARSRTTTARLLDSSWLADQQFFCPIVRLRAAGIRSHWRVAGARQSVALSLYGIDEGKSAAELKDLVPKYLPAGLPTDPYSGQPFRYRVAANGQATLWSTGPDRIDHGARNNGAHLTDEDARWSRGEFDLVTPVHHWP